ncbi:HlyD family efflux transporter periplasmic adaptor subunit [Geitlerinema sp. P-1104]|uniref:efflux RND transporter periplasmic adaptor subunit n=1 Tax=Geitlerinema sp. P-1104 TaxID=2546230 RepID=UPI0014772F5A|nr:HlyD family efflux transporter periplasmic adaptor subunit [Geitlerinema sp. P-1104]NMG59479.1 HlyD family efflux transporter periplasmic adaptor subunit [Geitlerinema sp. P-1104]
MTSQPQNQNSAPLRVVPPTTDTPQEQPAPPVPPTPDPDSETTSAKPQQEPTRHRWLWVGTAVATLGAVGFIPLPNHVRGDATLKTLPGQRQTIHMSRPGRVRLRVRPHDRVQPDQVLLSVESEDLADQLTEAERSLQEENAALEVAQQRLARSQQRLRNAEDQLHQAQRRLDAHLDDMRAIQLGIGIPQTRRFQEERGGVQAEEERDRYEIERLQGEVRELESRQGAIARELSFWSAQKQHHQEELDKLQPYIAREALQTSHPVVRDHQEKRVNAEDRMIQLEGEQEQNQARLQQVESQIRGQEASLNRRDHQANVTREQEQQVQWDLNQKRMDLEEERDRRQAERDTAHNERETATIQVQNHQEAIAARQAQLEDLRKRDAERTKTATISGIVLDHNLDQRDGAFMQAGQEVLQIANLSYLEVTAQIAQADYHLVEKGQLVEFRMRNQPRDITYRSSIENRRPLTDRRESGIEDVFEVTFHIENPENLRLPEDKGYVQIRTENRNFYQKIQHQFGKLIDLGYYFPWLAD